MSKNRFIVGSRAFFRQMKDFMPTNRNYLELIEDPSFEGFIEKSLRGTNNYYYKKEDPSVMIQRTIEANRPIMVGKFLVPEVAEALGLTVEDILPLAPLIEKLDKKQEYLQIIFNAYKANNSFTLTDEQREEAYLAYQTRDMPGRMKAMLNKTKEASKTTKSKKAKK